MMTRLLCGLALVGLLLGGCSEKPATTPAPVTAFVDPLLERAEKLPGVALATFDAWLFIEHQNRDLYRTNFTEAHEFSEQVRTNAPALMGFLVESTALHKSAPSEQTRRKLATAVAIVESHLRVCQNYIGEANQKSEGTK